MSSTEDLIAEGEATLKYQKRTDLYLSFIVKVLIHWLRRTL